MADDELKKKNELERKMERKINSLIILGVVILFLTVIIIGILIRTRTLL
jgi:hypothetical protein